MSLIKFIVGLGFCLALAACGGGGGSAGTPLTGVASSPATASSAGGTSYGLVDTLLTARLEDSTKGKTVQSVAAADGTTEIVATLTTKDGKGVPNQYVSLYSYYGYYEDLLFFPNGVTSLPTDADGIARIKVNRANLYEFGSYSFKLKFQSTNQYYGSLSEPITYRVDPPPLQLELRDASGELTTTVGATGFTTLKATLKFPDGTPVKQKFVEIADNIKEGENPKVSFPEGNSQLTDANGVATIKVTRASATTGGAGILTGTATISGSSASGNLVTTIVTGTVGYSAGAETGANELVLDTLNVGVGSLPAYGTRTISVKAMLVNLTTGIKQAIKDPVQVTFNASCGSVTPSVVTTGAADTATSTYTASELKCADTSVTITASAVGATPVTGTLPVNASVATNVKFIDVAVTGSTLVSGPQLIYLKDSVGPTQAQVVFQVVDSIGNPLPNQKLSLSLSNAATGVSLGTIDPSGKAPPVVLTTDSLGLVSAAVFSGTVPTSLNVIATLLEIDPLTGKYVPTKIFSNSNLLTVASGRPTQSSLSLSLGEFSIEAANIDGMETSVTLAMADRQGNPVPPGTQVNFVTESGVMLPAVCFVPPVTPATATSPAIPVSSCSVKLRSSGIRTASGRVSILAYVAGVEDFKDLNGNNVYDDGIDTFTDLGRAFRDDNAQVSTGADGVYNYGEFQVPRMGTNACIDGAGCPGDGVWGFADVRMQRSLVFATSSASISNYSSLTASVPVIGSAASNLALTGVDLIISDLNNNSMPTGSTIDVTVVDNTPTSPAVDIYDAATGTKSTAFKTCAINGFGPKAVPNRVSPLLVSVSLSYCIKGDQVLVTVTTPAAPKGTGAVTLGTFTIQ